MNIGKQLIAPGGYGPLTDDRTYYFLASQARRSRVLLVWFVPTKPGRAANGLVARPYMLAMDRDEFERGLLSRAIHDAAVQSALPPWLNDIADRQVDRASRSAANTQCVERRLRLLAPAVDRWEEILETDDPIATLNRYAGAAGANRMRFRTWFVSYVLFGFNDVALSPTYHRIGHWERKAHGAGDRPFGRPSQRRATRNAPRLSEQDQALIVETYRRYRRLGVTSQ